MKADQTKALSDRQSLIDSLWQDARHEADTVMAHARSQADELIEQAKSSVNSNRARALEEVREQMEPLEARILNKGKEQSRHRLLAAWHEFLDACFQEAKNRISRSTRAGPSTVRPLLAEALLNLPPSVPIRIEVAREDVKEAGEILREMGISAELVAVEKSHGGVVVKLDGGREVRDNSLEARLDVLRGNPPLELLERLLGRKPAV